MTVTHPIFPESDRVNLFKRLPSRTKLIAENFTYKKDALNQLLKEAAEESSS